MKVQLNNLKKYAFILLLLLLTFLISFYSLKYSQFLISDWTGLDTNCYQERGAFGDSFGIITSLFSSLTFFLVLYGIYYQRKEMSTQKEMLDLSRRQHYFDRAYEFLDKKLSQLESAQAIVLGKIYSERHYQYSEVWDKITTKEIDNILENKYDENARILNAIKNLNDFSNFTISEYSNLFSNIDKLIKQLLGNSNINSNDYECLQEIIKLTVKKEFKTVLHKAMKFYNAYKASKLFRQSIEITIEKDTTKNHVSKSEASFYNLLALNRSPRIFFEA